MRASAMASRRKARGGGRWGGHPAGAGGVVGEDVGAGAGLASGPKKRSISLARESEAGRREAMSSGVEWKDCCQMRSSMGEEVGWRGFRRWGGAWMAAKRSVFLGLVLVGGAPSTMWCSMSAVRTSSWMEGRSGGGGQGERWGRA